MIEEVVQKWQVVPIWSIVYDNDPSRVYTYSSWNKVVAAVEGSIDGYFIGNEAASDTVIKQLNGLYGMDIAKLVIVNVENLNIRVHRWEIDYSSNLHRMIVKCLEFVPVELRSEINQLFTFRSDCD